MDWNFLFFLNSALLGVGLAMDAFSVSIANALGEPKMKPARMSGIAGVYAGFQFLMPMVGWICVHTIVQVFGVFEKFIPWIALILLGYIGGKMLWEGFHPDSEEEGSAKKLSLGVLMVQGIATSIDALSVGFTIADYGALMAFVCSLIIAAVTFCICMGGLTLGKGLSRAISGGGSAEKTASRANLLGGTILVAIGLEIFIKGLFG